MIDQKKILVTGGSGMVGKFIKQILPKAFYLSSKDCDLTKCDEVDNFWGKFKPEVVIHLAARVGGIMDNINHTAQYYEQNVLMNTNVLYNSRKYNVDRLIAILSTCIYPDVVEKYPMDEDMLHIGPPTKTNFSYGYAKRGLSVHIDSYNQEYGTNYQYLIPCNLYGEFDKFGDNSHFVSSLIKKIIESKRNNQDYITLFGTGKPLRQFLYTKDLADIICQCIFDDIRYNFNVATNEVYTIEEIANIAIESIGDGKIKRIIFDPSKPDGQYRKDVSINKMLETLPDFRITPLHEGIKRTHDYIIKNKVF